MCVVGKKELVYQLVEELKVMQTNIREVTEQFEKTEIALTPEGLEDMRNDCLDMLKAILWVLDGAKYLWQDSDAGAEESPNSGNCYGCDNWKISVISVSQYKYSRGFFQ